MQLFAKAADATDKNDLSKQNSVTIAQMNFNVGLNAGRMGRADIAAQAYYKSLDALKKGRILKDNEFTKISYLCQNQ